MRKMIFTFLTFFLIISLKAQVQNPMALKGTWTGQWDNLYYSSSGDVTAVITVDEAAGTFDLLIDSEGFILGQERDPFFIQCTFDDVGWTADLQSNIWGDVDITGTWDGPFNGGAADMPVATNMITAGTISTTTFTRTFSFNHNGTTPVTGTENLTKLFPITTPTNLDGTEISSVNLTWDDNSDNEDGWKLDRKTGTDGTWEEIAVIPAGTSEYLDESVEDETEYFYRVAGYNEDTESEYSDEFDITTSPATDIEDYTNIPADYMLLQNYPNPFNPSTNIVFTLPRESHVKLSVYNLIGEEVAYILDGYRNSGRYEVTFHSAELTSGIYLLKMVATSAVSGNQFVDIKKMIVLK